MKKAFTIIGLGLMIVGSDGFVPLSPKLSPRTSSTIPDQQQVVNNCPLPRKQDTSLHDLIEGLPDNFFAFTFPLLGIMLSVSKNFGRLRMEERAWEQRVEEARSKRLREDPTLTEIELRRKEAAMEWSAYGKPRMDEERAEQERMERRRVKVMERDYDDDDMEDDDDPRKYRMTDAEVTLFEAEYGIDYDPYYDDPYSEDELPDDVPFNVDRKYGDRIYENGEIFYKDKDSGLVRNLSESPRETSRGHVIELRTHNLYVSH